MATYYFRNVTGNWNLAANWSLTSGGGSTGAVPTVVDTAILDSNSGSCTVTGASNCLNLTITGYTNTLTMNNTITVATTGTFTLGTTNVTVSGASAVILNGNNTLTSGAGGHYDGLISFTTNAGVKTLSSNFSAKSITITNSTTLIGSFKLICSGGTFNVANTLSNGANTPTVVMVGTSTFTSSTASVLAFAPNLTFSGTGTITILGTIWKSGTTITAISGVSVNASNSTLNPIAAAGGPIMDTQYMTWGNATYSGAVASQITMLSNLNISGTTLLQNNGGGFSFSGAGLFNPTGTLTLGTAHSGLAFPNTLNLNIFNVIGVNSLGNSVTINTQSFSGTGNLQTTSTPTLVFTGTGVWNSSGQILVNTIFNSVQTTLSGTSTFSVAVGTRSLTYSAGTIVTTSNTFVIAGGGAVNLDVKGSSIGGATTTGTTGINFNIFVCNNATNATLLSDLCAVTSFSGTGTINGTLYNIYIGGDLTLTGNLTGTAPLVMNGTGTWSGNFSLQKNLSINSTGTITLNGLLQYGNNFTLTYTAGIINVGTSTVSFGSSTISGSMNFWNLNPVANATITINTAAPKINNTLLLSAGTITFTSSGLVGFTATNFSSVTAGLTCILKTGTTYTINSSLVLTGTSASAATLRSSNATSSTLFNLTYGATQRVAFVTATDINSSGGQTIWDYKGTLTRTTNWNLLTTPITLAKTFVY